jgi:ParB/RepB/Spo0J family partition protein
MTTTTHAGMSRDIPVAHIDPDPNQPRKHFDQATIDELAQSMHANGLAVAILVRPVADRYVIVHGERRWRAAQHLTWATIPAIVRDISADEAQWLALIENVQRADLTPIEEARAFQLHLATGMTQEALGARIGKSQSYIAQKLRLLGLPDPLVYYLDRRVLTEGHARQILRLKAWHHDLTIELDGEHDSAPWRGETDPTTQARHVFEAHRDLRPEDTIRSIIPPTLTEHTALLYAALEALDDYATRLGGTVPLWVIPAFWWASLAVRWSLSVADLRTALDRWQERVYSTIVWWDGFGKRPPPDPRTSRYHALGHLEWWLYRADLRHHGLLRHLEAGTLPAALRMEATRKTVEHGGYLLPSSMQPGGLHQAEARELLEHEGELFFDWELPQDEGEDEASEGGKAP